MDLGRKRRHILRLITLRSVLIIFGVSLCFLLFTSLNRLAYLDVVPYSLLTFVVERVLLTPVCYSQRLAIPAPTQQDAGGGAPHSRQRRPRRTRSRTHSAYEASLPEAAPKHREAAGSRGGCDEQQRLPNIVIRLGVTSKPEHLSEILFFTRGVLILRKFWLILADKCRYLVLFWSHSVCSTRRTPMLH